ncbi:MAG: ABC transporter substrate-binding protein [Polyangiaceae bacterium]|nr:ABC transporter substrate-binding protein [Polyangiaceae bacterium]
MSARPAVGIALVVAALVAAIVAAARLGGAGAASPGAVSSTARIVALSPALTETLFAIGAGGQVVAVDDYSEHPEAARALPRVGSALRPDHERIVAARPTLVVGEQIRAAREEELARIARTVLLPWLTVQEIASSTRELGALTGRVPEADALAARLSSELSRRPRPGAPRVLLVLRYAAGAPTDIVYIRRGSVHGAALEAAGAENAVPDDAEGVPRLSLERVLALDPDAILVLTGASGTTADRSVVANEWRHLRSLRAVRDARVGAVPGGEAYSNGPRILDLVGRLAAELRALGVEPTPG